MSKNNNTIVVTFNSEEKTLRFNSSMRLKDFAGLNKLSDDVAEQVFAIAHETHKNNSFKGFSANQIVKMKEEIVKGKGGFDVKVTFTGKTRANESHAHLMDAYIDKANRKHAKVVEDAAIWQAKMASKVQDDGQTVIIQESIQSQA